MISGLPPAAGWKIMSGQMMKQEELVTAYYACESEWTCNDIEQNKLLQGHTVPKNSLDGR